MKEITFTIDPATGKLTVHIHGIKGPSCTEYSKMVEDYLGKAPESENTAEFSAKVQNVGRVRS